MPTAWLGSKSALAKAIEQQTATSQVLELMGRSDLALQPVFETVVRHAVRLCGADAGFVHQLDDDRYKLAFMVGGSSAYQDFVKRHPIELGPGSLVGRVGLGRHVVQIPDVLEDPDYQWHTGRELGGFRTILGVPILAGDRVAGVLTLWRVDVNPFGERTIDLLTTFAAQAAIAIRNVQLFQDLTRSVGELRALGEISQAVSSSLDLDEVLTTIVTRAVQLSGTEGGSILEFDQATRLFHVRTCCGTEPELVRALRASRIHLDETFVGRAAASGEPQSAPDISREARDPHIEQLARAGWWSMLVVPLHWEQEIIGALLVRRRVTGAFPVRTAELLETLASQSAVAIHNARVFRQLEDKSHQLEVASRHKSEFLASMSHELRTPLNAVIGFSDVLLQRMFGDLNERQDEYLRDIRDSGRHLLELINEILDLSRVEAGRMELDLAPLAHLPVLEHGLAMVREQAERTGVSLELTSDPAVDSVWADELKLKQVVLNLLTNAVKFTEAGGAVTVTARRNGDVAEVTVRDTGVGIAHDDRDGRDEIAIGVPREGTEGRSRDGVVHVLFGAASGLTADDSQLWSQDTDGVQFDSESEDFFGASLAIANFGKSQHGDLAIGVPFEGVQTAAGEQPGAGAVNVLYGSAAGPTATGDQVWHQDVEGVGGSAERDFFGYTLYAAHFGDGSHADLAVSAIFEAIGDIPAAGAVNVLYGTPAIGLSADNNDLWHQDVPGVSPPGEQAEPSDVFGTGLG